jgi:hypothetical protein
MYVTVVQTVVLYCNVSEYFSAVYYALCNSFNTKGSLGSAKPAKLFSESIVWLALIFSSAVPGPASGHELSQAGPK